MILPQNIYHVIPLNDLKPHKDVSFYRETFLPYCDCECKPEHQEMNPDNNNEPTAMIVLHHSFDGREGVEWVNELLNNKP